MSACIAWSIGHGNVGYEEDIGELASRCSAAPIPAFSVSLTDPPAVRATASI